QEGSVQGLPGRRASDRRAGGSSGGVPLLRGGVRAVTRRPLANRPRSVGMTPRDRRPPSTDDRPTMAQETIPQAATSHPRQAIAGLTPPQVREARIREEWPTALGISPALATVARRLVQSVIGLPLALPILGVLFALKIGPLVCRRYTLTNRRLMIQKGW